MEAPKNKVSTGGAHLDFVAGMWKIDWFMFDAVVHFLGVTPRVEGGKAHNHFVGQNP